MNTVPVNADNREIVDYNILHVPIRAKKEFLSDYPQRSALNHWHDDLEFILIISGEMIFHVNGIAYHLHEGEGIFVNAQQMHYGHAFGERECEFICVILPLTFFSGTIHFNQQYLQPFRSEHRHPNIVLTRNPQHLAILVAVRAIYTASHQATTGFELQIMGRAYEICYQLQHLLAHTNFQLPLHSEKTLLTMRKMVGFIQERYSEKISITEIAQAGNVCRSTCHELFQTVMQLSPMAYVNNYRLERSLALLQTSSDSITKIAFICGFTSSSYFTHFFRQALGVTPTQYRKK